MLQAHRGYNGRPETGQRTHRAVTSHHDHFSSSESPSLASKIAMSGAETIVGLAIGVLPLLISAVEHYDDCLRPFVRYKKFAREADRFQNLLGIQRTIFKTQCRVLLAEFIEQDAASSMLNEADHPLWSDIELEKQFCQLLGQSKDACFTIIDMIEESLQDIKGESQDLKTAIEQDSQVFDRAPS